MKKKITAIMLALIMTAALFPALPVYAVTTAITPTGGDKSGTGWAWDESAHTLTLSGAEAIPSDEITFSGAFSAGSLIINLATYTGATPSINFSGVTITNTNGPFAAAPTWGSAIYFAADSGSHPVIFNFTGTNKICVNDSAAYGGAGIRKLDLGSITINGSVDIFGGKSTGATTSDSGGYGILSYNGDVIINATGPINIVGGNSNAGSSGTSIYTNNDVMINGSAAVNITGGTSAVGWGYYCICAKNVTMDNSNTTIRGGNGGGSGGDAILALGSVTINKAATLTGGVYNGTGATEARKAGCGITTRDGGTININGTEQVTITGGNSIGATGNGGYGIYLDDDANLVISNPNAVITGGNGSGSGTKLGYAGSAIYIPNLTKTVTLPYLNITNLVPGTGNINGSRIFIGVDYFNQTSGKYNTLAEMKTNSTQIIFTGTEPSVPDDPTAVTATSGNGQASVSFIAPGSNGGSPITSYTVTSSPDGKTATGAASPLLVTGLTNGTAYTFTVTATNIAGTGIPSAASSAVIPFNAVTSITGAPTTGNAGTEIDLTGATVNPSDATNKTIVWSVKDAGTTGVTTANLATGKFTPATAGTLVVTATITNGLTESTNYTQDVTITVVASSAKTISAFSFNGLAPNVTGTVNEGAHTIALTVPYGTDVTTLVPTITHTGASVSPNTAVAQDFTNSVNYTVTAADNSTQAYAVTVTVAASSTKAITAFNFNGLAPNVTGTVNAGAHTIALTVPYGTDVTTLVPTITHTGASVSPNTAVAQDFTAPVTYTVTAADTSTQAYTVTVTVASSGGGGGGGGSTAADSIKTTIKSGEEVNVGNLGKIVSDKKELTVKSDLGTLVFDTKALSAIDNQTTEKITVVIEKAKEEKLSDDQKALVGDSVVYDLTVMSGGKKISDFKGGIVTVTLPYELKAGEKAQGVVVWYLADDGTLTAVKCTYDEKTKAATFTVNHFSKYVVGYDTAYDAAWVNPFKDVAGSAWYYESVGFAYQNKLMLGKTATSFSPDGSTTRSMIVSILWRMEGQPTASATTSFKDVNASAWYSGAVAWASANGIVSGYTTEKFAPEDKITREQMAAILYRYASFKGMDVSGQANLGIYSDASMISPWADKALAYANAKGLISGVSATTLNPNGSASRAQVAAILQRFIENTK